MVVTGAVIIAGIGFAGSYAAVRELAIEKGFGNFSYVFPIGIDAGICVLLALDLLLTWIRIPFPLLRQTAWLLTAATIAFNGAAAWPDPLGTGMHAVIPILFVVAVEAARHAIGRIADITADKHMEGVRITRWLLSPLPTFLLWRRMKLWELRSYDQVIKLEQERLVYQARLRSRFGRAWRRKAPVESLMPLRLARYGVPLAETAPAGLAAAGIEPPVLPAAQVTAAVPQQQLAAADPGIRAVEAAPAAQQPTSALPKSGVQTAGPTSQSPQPPPPTVNPRLATASTTASHPGRQATTKEPRSSRGSDNITPGRHDAHPHPCPTTSPNHNPKSAPAQPAPRAQQRSVRATLTEAALSDGQPAKPTCPAAATAHDSRPSTAAARPRLTTVDRYYRVWVDFYHQHHRYPDAAELSAHLADQGVLDRSQQPIKPKSLSRYLLQFRLYTTWAKHRATTHTPDLGRIAQELASQGITAQYNKPLRPHHFNLHLRTFEQRWRALNLDDT
ncbi:hypothetical protein Saso_74520 [Streptomyces asoensis]|uniref:DUF2637 domain-containing protein n=1 Tax=Streptomyces asoensis TaxID=249586 RepID=A0ABQ3SCE5_9ACTN|nr:DUF2637 domain-containing protein [Streptomyces asoensis]GHI65802.1 hypothetical protein Saso_74520 [Streptomyces asoensis]